MRGLQRMFLRGLIFLILFFMTLSYSKAERSVQGGYLKNSCFQDKTSESMLENWHLISTTKAPNCIQTGKDGRDSFVRLVAPAGASVLILQKGVKLEPGNYYELSCDVRSSDEDSRFRIYAEWRQPDKMRPKGVLKSFGGYTRPANEKWHRDKIKFYYPPSAYGAYIVINVRDSSSVDFKNIKLVKSKQIMFANGLWELYGDSKFVKNKMKKPDFLRVKVSENQKIGALIKNVDFEAGKKYCFSYRVAGEGNSGSTTGFHAFRVYVKVGSQKFGGNWDDQNNSYHKKKIIFTFPILKQAKGDIVFESKSQGALLFDDFKLEIMPAEKEKIYSLELSYPFYRNSIFSSETKQKIAGCLLVDPKVKALKISLVAVSDNKKIKELKLVPRDLKADFVFNDALAVGKYYLDMTFYKDDKNILERGREYIEKLSPAKYEVVYRSDNQLYINGKVFFPVVFWTIAGIDTLGNEALYWAARNGINTFIAHSKTERQAIDILDRADRYGMKVFLSTTFAPNTNKDIFGMWEHRLYSLLTKRVIQHPALLGYFLVDEPYWRGIALDNILASYKAIKSIDPYHPIWINAAPRGSLSIHQAYSQAADIYGIDIYPVPYPNSHSGLEDKNMTCVGKYVRRMRKAAGPHKMITAALQGFSWGSLKKHLSKGKSVYPKYFETRFMAYDAIVSGANSISYWGTQYIDKVNFYKQLFNICRELHQLSGILTQAKIIKSISSNNFAVALKAYKFGENILVIAINRSSLEQKCIIDVGENFPELNVLNENRRIDIKNMRFKDKFSPYDVNIYYCGNLIKPVYKLPPKNLKLEKLGNPMLPAVKNSRSKKNYKGSANWIWSPESVKKPYSQVWFYKSFKLDQELASAKLLASADDDYILYVNGKKIGEDIHGIQGGWSSAELYDCTKMMRKGENYISVYARDAGMLPCGFIADLLLNFKKGKSQNIVTDSSWLSFCSKPADFPFFTKSAGSSDKFRQAVIVAPFGSGAWGEKMDISSFK